MPAKQALASQPECILCGKCLEVCPLFSATGREELSPRGKSFVIQQALERNNLHDASAARKLLGLCLGCERCAQVCPQGRNLPDLLRDVRAGHPGWQTWLWGIWIRRARQLWPIMARCAGLLPEGAATGSMQALRALSRPPQVSGMFRRISRTVDLPRNAVLFPGCTARFVRPWWLENARRMLGPTGNRLQSFPDWDCCGFTVAQAGLQDLHATMQSRNVALWRELGRPTLVTLCATCSTALRGYAHSAGLFQDDRERLDWEGAIQPLSGLMAPEHYRSVGQTELRYHRPCHAALPDSDATFLRNVLGEQLIAAPGNACCGMGGAMQLSAPHLSLQVAARYWSTTAGQGPRIVATGCSGCVLQLAASAPQGMQVVHWLELLTD